jgi:hypothetical protein
VASSKQALTFAKPQLSGSDGGKPYCMDGANQKKQCPQRRKLLKGNHLRLGGEKVLRRSRHENATRDVAKWKQTVPRLKRGNVAARASPLTPAHGHS